MSVDAKKFNKKHIKAIISKIFKSNSKCTVYPPNFSMNPVNLKYRLMSRAAGCFLYKVCDYLLPAHCWENTFSILTDSI